MIRFFSVLCLFFFTSLIIGQNQIPEITNLQFTFDGANQMTLTYDLSDAENDDMEITFRVSGDDGETFMINTSEATGDLGFPVSPGTGKTISWDFTNAIAINGNYKIMLVADDLQTIDIQEIVDQVDSNRLRTDLEFIEGVRHRTAGAAHLQEVKNLITDHFTTEGLDTEIFQFTWNNYTAENIVGWKKGLIEETEIYIIDGHYDSVEDSPGADDNGSAIAGVMEALRVLAPYQFKKSIKFIAFDLEEEGLVGSLDYVTNGNIKDYETINGVFNFEMIGYYDDSPNTQTFPAGFELFFPDAHNAVVQDDFRGNFITNVGLHTHPELIQAFENASENYVPGLKVISLIAPNSWFQLGLGRSDHAAFWLDSKPALMLTDGADFRNPYYHTPNDTVGTLNFTFMSNVVKATVAAVAELAEVSHSSFQIADVEIITGIENTLACDFKIFPNPNTDFIQLDFSQCEPGAWSVKLYSGTGKLVYTTVTDQLLHDIPVQNLTSGIYVLKIKNGRKSRTERVMVLGR